MTAAEKKSLLELLTKLGQSVSALVDTVLGILVQALLATLDSRASSTHCLTSSVGHIINLGLEWEYMCYIIARVSVMPPQMCPDVLKTVSVGMLLEQ